MNNFLLRALLVMLCLVSLAALSARLQAQTGNGAKVVAVCGTLPQAYTAGSTRQLTVDVNGQVCQ